MNAPDYSIYFAGATLVRGTRSVLGGIITYRLVYQHPEYKLSNGSYA